MTNISRRKTKSKDYELAYQEMASLIAKLRSHNAHYLIDELLTESERIMLTKRFAAIFMFQQNYLPYRVSETVSISVSTAQRLYEQYENGAFDKLLDCMKPKDTNRFLALLGDLILAKTNMKARARVIKRAL